LDLVLITGPDRLARNYVHQAIVLEELERRGCRVEFLDWPMSHDPHDQLVLQIQGAVAEYERTLIADRMRRRRLAKLQGGKLLPWTRPHYGYRLNPEGPCDPDRMRIEEAEAGVVRQILPPLVWRRRINPVNSDSLGGGPGPCNLAGSAHN
jgi:site-specific DNA recombinase